MDISASTFDGVRAVLVRILGIQDRATLIELSTPLFGSMPELDSFAVVELASALEEEFQFEIDDEDFTADVFESVGTLVEFVDQHRQA